MLRSRLLFTTTTFNEANFINGFKKKRERDELRKDKRKNMWNESIDSAGHAGSTFFI